MRDKKKIVIGMLCVLVCIMAVGYAVLAQQLNITGTTSIDSTWKVEITGIQEKEVVGDATSKVTPSYTATTANFNVGLTQPGDSITYDIEISNLGTLNAVLESINVTMDENEAIKYTTSGLKRGDKLGAGEKTTLTIKVEYDSSITTQPSVTTKDITVTLNYQQDLGEDSSITYQTYTVGDTVTFAGSNWYVIKNSTAEEDYVTLMKETVLTNAELGDYAYNDTYDTMEYTWTETCHNANHGYSSSSYSCDNTNGYETSKVKEMLEQQYLPTIGATNLKEVDGYKIRLITTDEIYNNLGWVNKAGTTLIDTENSNTPTWVYQNFGDGVNNVYAYWTMTPHQDSSSGVWNVTRDDTLHDRIVYYGDYGVRPVINLLKSNI